MRLFKWANERVKQLIWLDAKLIALAGICVGLVLAKGIPSILNISGWWVIAIGVLCGLRVGYVILLKK